MERKQSSFGVWDVIDQALLKEVRRETRKDKMKNKKA